MTRVLFRDSLKVESAVIDSWLKANELKKADAVLVSHSHYDHAMDAGYFMKKTGAELYGSQSTVNAAYNEVDSKKVHVVKADQKYTIGKFTVTFRESEHGKIFLGNVPYPGNIESKLQLPASANEYKVGEVYSIYVEHPAGAVLHHASAGYKPDMFKDWKPEIVFLGIAGRKSTEDLFENIVQKVSSERVIPIHFDNFFRPLTEDIKQSWGVDLAEFLKTAQKYAPGVKLEALPIGKTVTVEFDRKGSH
jgi:L-ascorbate metabolism protein UlaG (beta-lactamase superfamily)